MQIAFARSRQVVSLLVLSCLSLSSVCASEQAGAPTLQKAQNQKNEKSKPAEQTQVGAKKSLPDCPLPPKLIRLPLVRQATDYTCGIGALASILAYYGIETREDELSKKLKSDPKKGTAYQRIADYAQAQGCEVRIVKNMSLADLKGFLDKQVPVLCLLQAWGDDPEDYEKGWQDGHYVVAAGYDHRNIYFMDPSTLGNFAYVPIESFLKRWHDTDGKERLFNFGMVISRDHVVFTPDVCKPME